MSDKESSFRLKPEWVLVAERYMWRQRHPKERPSLKELFTAVKEMRGADFTLEYIGNHFNVSGARISQIYMLDKLIPEIWAMHDAALPVEQRLTEGEMYRVAARDPDNQQAFAIELLSRPYRGGEKRWTPPKKKGKSTEPPIQDKSFALLAKLKEKLDPTVWKMLEEKQIGIEAAIKISKYGRQLQERQARLFIRKEINMTEL